MTVEQLIEQLQRLPPSTLVVICTDEDRNKYSPLSHVVSGLQFISQTSNLGFVHDPGEYPSEPHPLCCVLYPN